MVVIGWRAMYEQLLKDKRPRELKRLRESDELDEVLTLANKWARDTYRSLAPENASPMQQATAREIVIAQMVEEVEAIPKWSPEEEARRQARQAIPRPLSDARGARVLLVLRVPDCRPL